MCIRDRHKLVAFWDDNNISIDGDTSGWFTDDTPARFEAYGWNVIRGVDGHDAEAIKAAIESWVNPWIAAAGSSADIRRALRE